MRGWFSSAKRDFVIFRDIHEQLVRSGALNGASLLTRLRMRSACLLAFARLQASVHLKGFIWYAICLYYRRADRLFGGDRLQKYLAACEENYKQALATLAENTRQMQKIDEQLFSACLTEQALKNPNFVQPNSSHDRQ